MELPQGSGRKVLRMWSRVLPQAQAILPGDRSHFLLGALRHFTLLAWKQDCKILALKVTPEREQASLRLPADIDGMREWYTTTYQKHADLLAELTRRRSDPHLHPGREWRRGRGAERAMAAKADPDQTMYNWGKVAPALTGLRMRAQSISVLLAARKV